MMRGKTKIRDDVNVAFKIKRELHDQLKEYCDLTGRSIAGICAEGMTSAIKNLEKERNEKYGKYKK